MKPKLPLLDRKYRRRQRAIALVIVLAMVSMMTIFMLAIFSVSRTEHSSSIKYADGQSARELADTAVNVVMGQIWDGTQRTAANPAIWASQPGAIRRYNLAGAFIGGYKLYSSPTMQVLGNEPQMAQDDPPADWATQIGRFTDLNEPVIRPDKDGDGNPELVFPIIDPRAFQPGAEGAIASSNVEGFWYNQTFAGVQAATSDVDLNARLPMPVEWLYVLRNGALGTVSGTGESLTFVPATSGADNTPTELNPIVGRIAFWTDDESSKININTAGEPTFWSTPLLNHERDLDFAHFQPMSHEYQRYPGHPATVAMSSVLFPNQDMDLYGKTVGGPIYNQILRRKERIYEVMPKLHTGGSRAGTVQYWLATDTNQLGENLVQSVDLRQSVNERLYASVDDMMFAQRLGGDRRTRLMQDDMMAMNLGPNSAGVPIFSTPGQLERARFFLTAHSRVPEVNMYGMPRVAIWPVADEALGPQFRTGYDNLIAFCSSLGANPAARQANSYFFRRRDSRSATTDIGLPRNVQLLAMLNTILNSRVMPGGATFATKYDQGDATQILVQIFDYIRSTNLYDGFLAPTRQQMLGDGTQNSGDPRFRWETYARNGPNEFHPDGTLYRTMPRDHRTFTADRLSRWIGGRGIANDQRAERTLEYTMPGHGAVVPSEFQGGAFRGMGRFPAITEVGFHFICTADGDPDKGSFRMATRNSAGELSKPAWPGSSAAISALGIGALQSRNFVGGRTAVRINPMPVGTRGTGTAAQLRGGGPPMFLDGERRFWYSNFPPFPPTGAYGTDASTPADDPRNPANHPGFRGENWNATLLRSTPLEPGQRRVQGMINLELCVPMLGYGPVHPEFTLVVEGLDGLQLNGERLFNAAGSNRLIWKTGRELYHAGGPNGGLGTDTAGGYVDAASMVVDRRVRIAHPGLAPDPGYDASAGTSGDPYRGLRNYDLVTRFLTVRGNTMDFTGSDLRISVYAGHQITGAEPIQIYRIPAIGRTVVPVPRLVIMSSDRRDTVDPVTGGRLVQVEKHAPQWWSLSYGGALGRYAGVWPTSINQTAGVVDLNAPNRGVALGRFASWGGHDRVGLANAPRGGSLVWGFSTASGNHNSQLLNPVTPGVDREDDEYSDTGFSDTQMSETGNTRDMRGSDVLFSIVPVHGDPRHVLAKKVVEANEWVPHPRIQAMSAAAGATNPVYFAHNISRSSSNANPGFEVGIPALRLVPNANYNGAKVPDVPAHAPSIALASQFGDFDNGPGLMRDGGWLNKPDEGNTGITWASQNQQTRRIPTAYSQLENIGADSGLSYMTPNRMIPSPGMFGSLPSRVKGGQAWRTLLFRPNTPRVSSSAMHPGAPAYMGGLAPADHYIMDLFWMPIVEPYAISETFSSAGKVNINYQIVPFRHIRRSTALHAALKGEIMAAIPTADADSYLTFPGDGAITPARRGNFAESTRDGDYHFRQPWSDFNAASYGGLQKVWHRKVEVEVRVGNAVLGTLQQFENRFNFQPSPFTPAPALGLFRTASQICEIHLMPKKQQSNPGMQIVGTEGAPTSNGGDPNVNLPYTPLDMTNVAGAGFWATRQLTGDNTRERPYANLYGKITTQSNTFRVFYKAQVIRKARSVAPDQFDPGRDRVASEYRGTTLIERKLDANDPRLPDYAAMPTAAPLDSFYRFRVLETKRFAP